MEQNKQKLSAPQQKALHVVREYDGMVANGMIADRYKITFATLESLLKIGLLTSELKEGRWEYRLA